MKKTFLYSVLFATILLVASCEKEKAVVDYLPATISNYQGMAGTKVYIDDDLFACWSPSGDVVKLNSVDANVVAQTDGHFKIAVTTPANVYFAIFPANAVTDASNHSVTLPAIQHYEEVSSGVQKVNALMAAKGTTRLDFKNICALLKVTVSGIPSNAHLTFIEVSHSDMALSGTGTVTFSSTGEPSLSMATSGSKMIKLQFDENGHENGDYYITVPPVTGKFTVRISYRAQDANGVIQLYTKTFKQNSSCTLNANEIGPVAASNVSTTPVEHLPGAFTTNNGVVYFSRGVLKCERGSSNTVVWTFENNQYSASPYSADGGQQSQFHSSSYMPYSTENNHSGFPILDNHGSGTFWDWGQHVSTQWSTLSRADWDVLLNERSASTLNGVTNARYAYAKVNNQYGVMLFPDIFAWPQHEDAPTLISSSVINAPNVSVTNAPSYDLNAWKELEDAGCVFLPALGYYTYQGNTGRAYTTNNEGWYWTSDPVPSTDVHDAYYMHFPAVVDYHPVIAQDSDANHDYDHMNTCHMGYGLLVRLVYKY